MLGMPALPETLGDFLNDRRPEYENFVAAGNSQIPWPGNG